MKDININIIMFSDVVQLHVLFDFCQGVGWQINVA